MKMNHHHRHYLNHPHDQEIVEVIILSMFLCEFLVVKMEFQMKQLLVHLMLIIHYHLIDQMNDANVHVIDDDPTKNRRRRKKNNDDEKIHSHNICKSFFALHYQSFIVYAFFSFKMITPTTFDKIIHFFLSQAFFLSINIRTKKGISNYTDVEII